MTIEIIVTLTEFLSNCKAIAGSFHSRKSFDDFLLVTNQSTAVSNPCDFVPKLPR